MIARWLVALVLCLGIGAGLRDQIDHWIDRTELPPLTVELSTELRDRDGVLLRPFLVSSGHWRLRTSLDEVDPNYIAMLIAYEDKRFRDHSGVDWRALLRAAGQALRHGRITSGGSTLTMQTARLLEGGSTGKLPGKLRQMRVALALERRLSKDQILSLYLNRAPFGGNIEGTRAASLTYFGKPPRRLTPAEAALLVALPQSPERRRPDRHHTAAEAARDRVLARVTGAGVLSLAEAIAARRTPVPDRRKPFPKHAAHLGDHMRASQPGETVLNTTLDHRLQIALEGLALTTLSDKDPRSQIAIMVADHHNGEIRAWVGSAAYDADGRQGFVDMTQAERSPGSTLKPLIYGLAFSRAIAHPNSFVTDAPIQIDGYAPQNFDGRFRGELSLAKALQLSLNIPAVLLLDKLGPAHFLNALRKTGAQPKLRGSEPGLAIALGGLGVTLEDTLRVFATLAQQGRTIDIRAVSPPSQDFVPHHILTRSAAGQVTDILRDTPRPWSTAPRDIAFKTGTSYGHRDTWAFGYDARHVVGVWLGRPDGTPVPGAFGQEIAAPVLFEVFAHLDGAGLANGSFRPRTQLQKNASLPAPLRRIAGRSKALTNLRMDFPPQGAALLPGEYTAVVGNGMAPYSWIINGQAVSTTQLPRMPFETLTPGFNRITVIDTSGNSQTVEFETLAGD